MSDADKALELLRRIHKAFAGVRGDISDLSNHEEAWENPDAALETLDEFLSKLPDTGDANKKLSQYMAAHKVSIASDRPSRYPPPEPGSFWWHQRQKLIQPDRETITVEELALRAGTTVEEARDFVHQRIRDGLAHLRKDNYR